MSNDAKLFARPKVRFSQSTDNEPRISNVKHTTVEKTVVASGKPKIKSIVSFNKPIKILSINEAPSSLKSRDPSLAERQKQESLSECSNASSPKVQLLSSCENTAKINNTRLLSNESHVKTVKASSNQMGVLKSSISECDMKKNTSAVTFSITQNEGTDTILKPQNNVNRHAVKGSIKNKGKENEGLIGETSIKSAKKDETEKKKTHQNTKAYGIDSNVRKSNVTTSKIVSNTNSKGKPKVTSVMPCLKYTRVSSKMKALPVKKTVIRDIVGRKVKPYIGPGLLHKKQDNIKTPETKENIHTKVVVSGEKLARPEYNSITCTINKLKEVKKEKVVTDIQHLPNMYRNFVNGKISSALDFPLDEAIYKNLVELSIDEKQLPSRLTRCKDPEPRQRDVVPVLSDFFTPVSTEEYCTPVSVKSRTPESIDSWNAFRISNKIFEWKHNMDHA